MTTSTIVRLAVCLLASPLAFAQNADRQLQRVSHDGTTLELATSDGRYLITPFSPEVVETTFIPNGQQHDPASHAVVAAPAKLRPSFKGDDTRIEFATPGITVVVDRQPFRISYLYKGKPLVAEKRGYGRSGSHETIEFSLEEGEALYGAGARAVGMNRRGNRFRLYNRADYGYGKTSQLLNYTIPVALSSKKYAIHFDNPQVGYLDFDSRKDGTLVYEVIGGRKTYQVVAGDSWDGVMANYTALTGRQPLPPRWAFGNFASRFGYRSEAETRAVVDKFIDEKIPLDAVVLDLFWFGKTVKDTMGNLAWDRDTFPNAEKMMADFRKKGVRTIVITEPFILTTSKRWQEAVDRNVLATDENGKPATYDFYFGNTGIVDLYTPQGRDWFWDIYKGLKNGGVGGWWGDLGEPEVHPSWVRHGAKGEQRSADQVHNIYGHDWARLIFDGYRKEFPNERPFILMRAGYSGSQRFGMIPWSGDVSRGWGGLQSQMEIALQMGMQGLAYMHSDLGGFAGPVLDDELYLRWLQYGVFQPVFRPHAQQDVAPEPVFRSERTKVLAREAVWLRYAMLPYNYTLAFDNNQTGMPLMRPVLFEDDEATGLSSTYLWGRDFLVAPVVEPGATRKEVHFPKDSVWFDFHTGEKHLGGILEVVRPVEANIPVYVRAGAFVPMAKVAQSTRDYSTRHIDLHYYHDETVAAGEGKMYDDDGETAEAYEKGRYEIVRFASSYADRKLEFKLQTETGKAQTPAERGFALKVHNVAVKPRAVSVDGRAVAFTWNSRHKLLEVRVAARKQPSAKVVISL